MTVKPEKLRIGTRGSPLALKQTEMVRAELARVAPDLTTEVVVIKTSGDWKPEDGEARLLESAGGKGQFAKEIEAALLAHEIDIAVHSMKDMETTLPAGLSITHMLPRANPFDILIANDLAKNSQSISDLKQGAVVGTCSVRRQAFLLGLRPDLKIVPMRGNVQTRIDKLRAGQVDATLLAVAGLERLGLAHETGLVLSAEEMLPAAGQGAIGIEHRAVDMKISALLDQVTCRTTTLCVTAERAALRMLDGSCHTPIGAYAVIVNGEMQLCLAIAALDGSNLHRVAATSQNVYDIETANIFGKKTGAVLKAQILPALLSQRIEESA